MRNSEDLIALRPTIELEMKENKSELELFMHQTLRPILKLQHEIILIRINSWRYFDRVEVNNTNEVKRRNDVKQFISKNIGLKNQLTAIITGLFTTEEFNFYLLNEKVIEHRISDMVLTRFLSENK